MKRRSGQSLISRCVCCECGVYGCGVCMHAVYVVHHTLLASIKTIPTQPALTTFTTLSAQATHTLQHTYAMTTTPHNAHPPHHIPRPPPHHQVSQYLRLLAPLPPLYATPNINALWARLLIEESCRLGANTFAIAPGSRSSPLAVAIAQHTAAHVVCGIDERSLGFWALGYARATGRPAVLVCSSGVFWWWWWW